MKGVFDEGDQDYGSAAGWDPEKEKRERLLAEPKAKNPRAFSEPPEMLLIRPVQEFVTSGSWSGPMKQLFGPFWLEEEVAVLYSPPGSGKTALAVQIGESLARGVPLPPFDKPAKRLEVAPQRVLYLDFELTRAQFSQRYTVAGTGTKLRDPYKFSPDFLRAEHYWNGKLINGYEDFTDMLFEDIDRRIEEHDPKVLIADNITFLSKSSTANASIAFRLMSRLQQLKKDHAVSVLAVAHTPKHAAHRPITMNHLQGSVDLAKVADSMFVLGRSYSQPDLRYIKHVKSRTGTITHGDENVVMYRFDKMDLAERLGLAAKTKRAANFLGFDFVGFDEESAHLGDHPNTAPKPRKINRGPDRRVVAYARTLAARGLSSSAVAERLGVSKTTAHRYIQTAKRPDRGEIARPT